MKIYQYMQLFALITILNKKIRIYWVLRLKDLEDEIANAEESINKLKEQARILSQVEIPDVSIIVIEPSQEAIAKAKMLLQDMPFNENVLSM